MLCILNVCGCMISIKPKNYKTLIFFYESVVVHLHNRLTLRQMHISNTALKDTCLSYRDKWITLKCIYEYNDIGVCVSVSDSACVCISVTMT